MTKRISLVTATILLGGGTALAQPAGEPTPPPAPPPTTEPAPPPAPPPVEKPVPPPPEVPVVVTAPPPPAEPPKKVEKKDDKKSVLSKIDVQVYGFVEGDTIFDSTRGLNDLQGNAAIARPNTYAGDHPQVTFGARNSRIGLKLGAPAPEGMKITGTMEMDFLGNQPPGISEASFWQNPTMRYRHMNVRVETKVVDLLFGQTWQLFGWQSMNQPNTVAIQGVPGQIYSRAPQVRISKKIPVGAASFELAVAASRPVSRASASPDGQAGLRLNFDSFKAWHTGGSTGSSLDAAMIGVSVVGRRLAVDEFSANPHSEVVRNGYGISVDALLPIIPASKEHHDNAFTIQGSYVNGAGIADLYTGLSGGVANPSLPNPGMANPAPTYTSNIDNALVLFHKDADGTFSLHPIQWTSYLAGFQYYMPGGNTWISANYSHLSSNNAHLFGAPNKVFDKQDWFDGNLFWDATANLRFGLEFSRTQQTYVDKVEAVDNRMQFSAFLLF